MNKKLCLILVSICFLSIGSVSAQWIVEQSPSGDNLKAITFTGNNTGWIVGDNGTILSKKENQWRNYQTPTTNNLNGIFMINEREGWAVGDRGTIIHFNGKSWENIESPVKNNLYSVSFNDAENGIAVGANGVILKYENRRWKSVGRKIQGNLYTTSLNSDAIWIGGGLECVNFPLMKIQNDQSGKVANSIKLPATITGLAMINPQEGWAVGSPSTIMHFDGNNWNKADLDFSYPSLRSVFFSNGNNGITAGYSGTVLIYSGGNWTFEKTTTSNNLNGTSIAGNSYYAVGDKGTIITKQMDPVNYSVLRANPQNKLFNLEIFPNPSDEIINFSLPLDNNFSTFTASVSSNSGQVLFQNEFQSGNGGLPYQIATRYLSNGLYILKVNLGTKTYSSKFIIKH
jgi:photosystem II stability/assembly factor-like uncharacterized protein